MNHTGHSLGDAAQTASAAWNTGAPIVASAAVSAGWLPVAAVPVIGPVVAGVGIALALIFNRKGPKQKTASTAIVNDLEPLMKQNLEGYINGPRTEESKAAALANFDQAWAYLASAEACGNPALGNPGKACLADRARGGKWDWFSYYRDPIEQDTPRESIAGLALPEGTSASALLIPAGLILAALVL